MKVKKEVKNHDDKSESRKIFIKLIFIAVLTATGFLLPVAAKSAPAFIEKIYSGGLYVAFRTVVGGLSSLIPFSLTEVVIAALLIAVIVFIVILFFQLLNHKVKFRALLSFVVSLLLFCASTFNAFYFFWGFNFFRQPVAVTMNLDVTNRSVDELYAFANTLGSTANELRTVVPTNADGVFDVGENFESSFSAVVSGFDNLSSTYPVFDGESHRIKSMASSLIMSKFGASGMFMPFFIEANVNTDQPSLLILSTAAHESAHYVGFAREDEANFIAYLACNASNDPSVRYSGTMLALINTSSMLYSENSEMYSSFYANLSDGVKLDLLDYSEYWKQFEGDVQDTARKVNDSYLKHNGQSDGIKSYGEMVDLLLAYAAKTQS